MYKYGVSGQVLFFGLFNTASGLPITSGASAISAKRTVDNSGLQTSCSGVVTEPGSGQYAFQGWAADFTGNHIGFMFTASGAAPIHYNVDTEGAVSGAISPASGAFAVASLISGQQVQVWSGTQVNTFSGQQYLASGQAASLNSGQSVLVYSGQLSGQPLSLISGLSYVASGIFTVASLSSGQVYLSSGQAVSLNSGQSALIYSGQMSGQQVMLLSGASVALLSGQQVAILSGATVALFSGQSVSVYSGQMSGQWITAASVLDKSGYVLSSGGLDQIQVESGMNFRQSQSVVAAAAGGKLSGAGTSTILIDGAGVAGTNRITATVTASGNRTSIVLNLPS